MIRPFARAAILSGASALALVAFAAAPAHAQCVQIGPSVTCAADDPDGFASADDGLDITVDPGIRVENPAGDAFDLDDTDDQTLRNSGEIVAAERGVDVDDGSNLTVDNEGLIDAVEDAIRAGDGATVTNTFFGLVSSGDRGIDSGDALTVLNDGLVDSENDAIRGEDGARVTNTVDGALLSTDQEGVDADDDLTLINDGVIDAGDEGVQANLRSTILNGASGLILATDDAIQIQGDTDIVNEGTIESIEEDGIDADSGTIVNASTGVIESFGAGAAGIDVDALPAGDVPQLATLDLLITNEGVIRGETGILVDPANTQAQIVRNSGQIFGTGGTAMDLGPGADLVEIIGAGLTEGETLFGEGDDTLLVSAAGSGRLGGPTGFFDGGDEDAEDLLDFRAGFALSDVFLFSDLPMPGNFRIGVDNGTQRFTVFYTGFETFAFDDGRVGSGDLGALGATVPVPAGLPLALGGLAALALAARRRG